MVTSTPPLQPQQQQNGPATSSNGSVGFQPTQLGGPLNPANLQQLQLLMRFQQQQQQQLRMPPHQGVMSSPIALLPNQLQLLMLQMLQQRQQQEHGAAAMLNSPLPNNDLSFQTSTPMVNTDSSSSSGHLSSFLSPQQAQQQQQSPFANGTPTSTTAATTQSDQFQMPLSALNNTAASMVAAKPQRRRNRPGGPSVKTAEVWRFFKSKPPPEQAAICDICQKTIKATNSSTTGMIRHLRSCHHEEYKILEEARNHSNFLKTLSACTDEKSRENLFKAFAQAKAPFFNTQQQVTSSTSHLADSSTASSVSPNSTASSMMMLRNGSAAMHSVDSLLVENSSVASSVVGADGEEMMDEERKIQTSGSSTSSKSLAPPLFASPKKYMQSIKSKLSEIEHNAKKSEEQRNENRPLEEEEMMMDEDEDEEQDEDVENLAVTEEDSEEDVSIMAKRQKLNDNTNKHEFREQQQQQKPVKQGVEGIEKIIALMLLLDDLSPELVDQPGFRLLFTHLAPNHTLPSATEFKTKIMPQLKKQFSSGDITAYRQKLMENNRFHQPTTSSSSHPQWPISPSTTAESGFEETIDVHSETASSASLNVVENSIRSAQNISQSFGYSTNTLPRPTMMMKKPKLEVEKIRNVKCEEEKEIAVKREE